MRCALVLPVILLAGLAYSPAFAGTTAQISKENGYAVLQPPTTSALISKENGYAVLQPPTTSALISKENGYAILQPPTTSALISKMNAYAVVTAAYPTVQILQ